jgi:hypothetical protein
MDNNLAIMITLVILICAGNLLSAIILITRRD